MEQQRLYHFGPFCLDTKERVLLRDGRVVPLTPKALRILLVLVRNKGHVVEKDVLMDEVWPDEFVEEGNLAQHVFMVRRALGETTEAPGYIETIPRRGYRFLELKIDPDAASHINCQDQAGTDENNEPPHLVAVLPFNSNGDDHALEHLSDGITESLINSLSMLPQLRVTARSTVFRYKGSLDHVSIGRDLRVQFVLVGRIEVRGDKLMIATELVDVTNGWQLWGRSFNTEANSVFDIQDEITREIASSLGLKLIAAQEQSLTKRYTESSEAYQAYLKGRFYWSKRSEAGLHKSINHFNQAIGLDPKYALAHAGLADTYNVLGFYSMLAPTDAFPKARAAGMEALSIDSNLAEPHASLGFIKTHHEWDWHGAEQCFRRSIKLNPNYVTARLFYGSLLVAMSRFDEAIAQYKLALEIDPLSLIATAGLGYAYYFSRRYDEAIEQCGVAIDLDEHFEASHVWGGWAYQEKGEWERAILEYQKAISLSGGRSGIVAALGAVYALSGNKKEARRVLRDLNELATRKYVSAYRVACIHAALGDTDKAFACLEKAYGDRSHLLVNLRVDPKLDSLRADPRFANLLERVFTEKGSASKSAAYQPLIRGRVYWSQHTRDGYHQAIDHFRQAIDLDPDYVFAYAALVDCYLRLATNYFLPQANREQPVLPPQIRSMEEVPSDARELLKLRDEWDLATANSENTRAMELKSIFPEAHQWRAAYLFARKLYEEKLSGSNDELDVPARTESSLQLGSATTLSPSEEIQVLCIITRDQVQAGNIEAGRLVLGQWVGVGQWPRLEGLSQQSSADLLLTAGLLVGRVGNSMQLRRGQIHAEALINGALGLFEQLGLKTRAAECKSELGRCYDREGKFDLARSHFQAALEDLPPADVEAKSKALRRLAFAEMKMGHLHESLARLEEASDIVGSAGPLATMFFHIEMATTLGELAIAESSNEYFKRACRHYNKALFESEAVGNHRCSAVIESNYGYLLLAFAELPEAESRLVRARELFDHLLDRSPELDEILARLYLETGQFESAEQAITRSVIALEQGGEEAHLAESLRTYGLILCKLNRRREAQKAFDRAYQTANLCGDEEGAGLALLLMIEQLPENLEQGELPETLRLLDVLLGQSQRASIIERLTKCRQRVRQRQKKERGHGKGSS